MAIRESEWSRLAPVGNLVQIQGGVVEVARQSPRLGAENAPILQAGLITLNRIEELSANSRQQRAVNTFLYGGTANPNLASAIIDPSIATSYPQAELEYFQDWLSDDKKDAVSKAVSSNELFLIQGPPGTGKTSVISEIALQILRREPDARILLASQSNVAVDHALAQIARAAGDSPPEMVRVGRPEKVASGGRAWTLEERAKTWRQETLGKCEPIIDELRRSERELRAKIKASIQSSDTTDADDAATIEEWIGEAKEIAAQIQEYRQEYSMIGASAPDDVKQDAADTVEYAQSQLRSQLEALNELLPKPVGLGDMDEEAGLEAIIRAAAASGDDAAEEDPDARELRKLQDIRTTLTQWVKVAGLTGDFQELIAKSARVVGATCLFSGKTFAGQQRGGASADANKFDWAIVDEAGRATLPEMLVPIVQSERTIMVGDERQLPPMVDDMLKDGAPETEDGDSLDTSLFQSLAEQMEGGDGKRIASLRTQYRMRPEIGSLVSEVFYEGGLENGAPTRARRRVFDWMPAPVTWLSTSSLPNKTETRAGESYANSAESGVILDLLEKMETKCRERRRRPTVGVIAGYSGQVERLNSDIEPENREKWRNLRIEIATVDSFQGRECDAVIYSTVRSNSDGNIGFLRDHRRVNVALSRARDLLAIVGDNVMMQSALTGSALNPFGRVLNYIQSHSGECKIVHSDMVRFL